MVMLGPIAATLALLMVAGVVGWRLESRQTTMPATVKPTPSPSLAPNAAIDPSNCRLPVVVMRESGPPGQLTREAGSLNTRTAEFTADRSGSVVGLPGGAFEGTDVKPALPAAPTWYDEAVGRWLPVGPELIAPDGRSYAWVRLLPPGSNWASMNAAEVHRYDIVSGRDRTLWTHSGQVTVSWDDSGIVAEVTPMGGGQLTHWLIDPATGTATQQPYVDAHPRPVLLPGEHSFESFGEVNGHTLYRIGSRQAGDEEWVFYESAPGVRVTIYKGTQGDATGFDPFQALADATGVWFSDFEMRGVWHWTQQDGLKKIPVSGLPPLLSGPNSSEFVDPAGPCM